MLTEKPCICLSSPKLASPTNEGQIQTRPGYGLWCSESCPALLVLHELIHDPPPSVKYPTGPPDSGGTLALFSRPGAFVVGTILFHFLNLNFHETNPPNPKPQTKTRLPGFRGKLCPLHCSTPEKRASTTLVSRLETGI